jgi:hypothetical protein
MSRYTLKNHVTLVNRGRDDEFEVTCDVSFSIGDVAVTLSQASRDDIPEAIRMIEAEIEDALTENVIVLNDEQFAAFKAVLNDPPAPNEALLALMRRR